MSGHVQFFLQKWPNLHERSGICWNNKNINFRILVFEIWSFLYSKLVNFWWFLSTKSTTTQNIKSETPENLFICISLDRKILYWLFASKSVTSIYDTMFIIKYFTSTFTPSCKPHREEYLNRKTYWVIPERRYNYTFPDTLIVFPSKTSHPSTSCSLKYFMSSWEEYHTFVTLLILEFKPILKKNSATKVTRLSEFNLHIPTGIKGQFTRIAMSRYNVSLHTFHFHCKMKKNS